MEAAPASQDMRQTCCSKRLPHLPATRQHTAFTSSGQRKRVRHLQRPSCNAEHRICSDIARNVVFPSACVRPPRNNFRTARVSRFWSSYVSCGFGAAQTKGCLGNISKGQPPPQQQQPQPRQGEADCPPGRFTPSGNRRAETI